MAENNATSFRYCSLKPTFLRAVDSHIDPRRAEAIISLGAIWANGTNLHYYFNDDGDNTQRKYVTDAFALWKNKGIGLSFEEVKKRSDAEIRIHFEQGNGSWSYVGKECLTIPIEEPTMNFGWDIGQQIDTAAHEIGHALGLQHEHQSPFAGIKWDEEKVYEEFAKPPNNWDRATTYRNIIQKMSPNDVGGSKWDVNSIMHYPFNSGLILEPKKYRTQPLIPKGGLSDFDANVIKQYYPPIVGTTIPTLKPFQSVEVQVKEGATQEYLIVPEINSTYVIQTLGSADTVLVLFELTGDDLTKRKFLIGDDDSGTDRNALIKQKLDPAKKYVISVRLYSKYKSGKLGLVMSYS